MKNIVPIFFGIAVVLFAASLTWLCLEPPALHIPPDKGERSPNAEYAEGGAGCKPQELAALLGARGLRQSERCAEKAEDHRQQVESVTQAARGARAAEQGAFEAYFQARAIAFQCVLLVLAFGAAFWAAWEARKGAEAIGEQVRLARDEFDADHRPWLAIRSFKVISDIVFPGGLEPQMFMGIEFTIENTGSVPAINVLPHAIAVRQAGNRTFANAIKAVISDYTNIRAQLDNLDSLPANIVFAPGEITYPITLNADMNTFYCAPNNADRLLVGPAFVGAVF